MENLQDLSRFHGKARHTHTYIYIYIYICISNKPRGFASIPANAETRPQPSMKETEITAPSWPDHDLAVDFGIYQDS